VEVPEVDKTPLEISLGRYQSLVVGGLAFIVVFAVTVMGVMLWQAYRMGQTAEKVENIAVTTHSSLCALQDDIQIRHDNNVIFLESNPRGIPGITPAMIQESIDGYQSTLDALAAGGLKCP
jgi:lipopolysaccharide export LptBFGC system permease protein LptF